MKEGAHDEANRAVVVVGLLVTAGILGYSYARMTANVRVVAVDKPSVLRVPNAALRFRPTGAEAQGGGAASRPAKSPSTSAGRLYILGADGKPTPVMVTLGITDGTATEMLQSELTEGQEVIVGLTGSVATSPQPSSGASPRLRL